ncbi:MAG: sodium-dependent transporter [Candidatus Aminicenantes bacterium]|nr:sodium-dependent transporter [Candidatus Aminicenantes bacterium]MDH5714943.1 sodium-dependent transporter [Candidatus Aminicenantes bacterium]
MAERERWETRIGLVLAMAGNAVGLGNFLRFPRQAALNGGGAFMVPYFCAFILMGIPLMWLEWTMGRYGGQYGRSTTAGQFDVMWRNKSAKYIGSIGISIPLLFAIYYIYIESWTLAYAFFSLTRKYFGISEMGKMNTFLQNFQGVNRGGEFFPTIFIAIFFWIITLLLNVVVIGRGISRGIEKLAKVAMPLLCIFGIILVIKILALGTPDPRYPDRSVMNGLAYIWNPNFSRLTDFSVWLAAAGQIFFTLSIGTGTIQTYASYLRKDDDCILTGLSTSATNEFVEVVLGGSIAIPIAVAFFGLATTQMIARQGSFDLGFVAMPIIFQKLPLGFIFGTMWFILLFFAGITSSVALTSPLMALLKENLGITRKHAAKIVGLTLFIFGLPIVFFLKHGYMDQYDFWIGTVFLAILALFESLVFIYTFSKAKVLSSGVKNKLLGYMKFGMDAGWEEMNRGADIKIPRIFYYILKYIVPIYLIVLFCGWLGQDLSSETSAILMRGVDARHAPFQWVARLSIIGVILGIAFLVRVAWNKKR